MIRKDGNIIRTKKKISLLISKIEDSLDEIYDNVQDINYYDTYLDELAFLLQSHYMELDNAVGMLKSL